MAKTFPRIATLILPLICAIGCAGQVGGVDELIAIDPPVASVQVNSSTELEVVTLETNAHQIEWSVREANGGIIAPDGQNPPRTAIYTAPGTPGTYRVRARCTTNTSVKTVESVVTVITQS